MKSLGIEQFIKKYLDHYHNFKSGWNYEDSCVLSGCIQLFRATGDEYYKDFVLHYMEDFIEPDGSIRTFEKEKYNIDNINPGKALFFLYEKTGEDKYRGAIDTVFNQLRTHPRTQCGNFWHKKIYPNQIWLDGLYMAQPFYMAYETRFNGQKGYEDIINQFVNVKKHLYNRSKGLYYHAYDEAGLQKWADKATGQSPNFWLRSIGWYLMALIDTMEVMEKESLGYYQTLVETFREAVDGILRYQDKESKLFYQIVDKADIEGNYLETSGTAMIAYSIMKGCGLGVLQKEKYQKTGVEIFYQLAEQKLSDKDGDLHLCGICSVAGLGPGEERDGSIAYYLSEKVVCDDPKGVGAFMMAYAQIKNLSFIERVIILKDL